MSNIISSVLEYSFPQLVKLLLIVPLVLIVLGMIIGDHIKIRSIGIYRYFSMIACFWALLLTLCITCKGLKIIANQSAEISAEYESVDEN